MASTQKLASDNDLLRIEALLYGSSLLNCPLGVTSSSLGVFSSFALLRAIENVARVYMYG